MFLQNIFNLLFVNIFLNTFTSKPNNSASALPNLDEAPSSGLMYLS